MSEEAFRYVVGEVDLSGVPFDVARCATADAAIETRDSLDLLRRAAAGSSRSVYYFAFDSENPDLGHLSDAPHEPRPRRLTRNLDASQALDLVGAIVVGSDGIEDDDSRTLILELAGAIEAAEAGGYRVLVTVQGEPE